MRLDSKHQKATEHSKYLESNMQLHRPLPPRQQLRDSDRAAVFVVVCSSGRLVVVVLLLLQCVVH